MSQNTQMTIQMSIIGRMEKKDVACICTQWNISAMRKMDILLTVTAWMDLEHIMLNVVSQTEKELYSITYM